MPRTRVPRALRPFRLPAYRRLAVALLFSVLASGVWLVAMVWEVIRIGGDPAQLGMVAVAATVASLVSLLPAGVAADRYPQKYLMLVVHAMQGLALTAVAVLAAADQTRLWHLVVVAALVGVAGAFAFPAYSAWVPALVDGDDLLAVNGIEGVLRPAVMMAGGPAVAGGIIAVATPGAAVAVAAGSAFAALAATLAVPRTAVRGGEAAEAGVAGALRDVREGAAYLVRTRWLFASLALASAMVLAITGPIEVVLPFLLRDELSAGPGGHATALAAFGIGGAVASLVVASFRFPRRYLTVTTVLWAGAAVPLLVIALAGHLAVVVVASAVLGACFSAPNVVWGTVLQRRVPPRLLGRVSSLDFLVSNTFTPASMALAGPLAVVIGSGTTFLALAAVPPVAFVLVLVIGRLRSDELANPLTGAEDTRTPAPATHGP